ncbi:HNH endonuclease [Chloroflexota bacterium]
MGHNKDVARGGKDNITNLRPICRICNTSMGIQTIEIFKAKHFSKSKPDLKQSLGTLSIKQL